ncbi:MAG TPA: carboxypeptidase regulatory-like domain-containing protein, partial [Kofleriaceae bacterium]
WIGWKLVGPGGGSADSRDDRSGTAGGSAEPGAHRLAGRVGSGPGQVSGTVLDAADRKPVAGVDVTFGNAFGESTATSGADGRYALSLAPGTYKVVAIGDGVLGAGAGRFELRPRQSVTGYDIWVARLAAIRGRVVDHGGKPVAGARVTFKARMGERPIDSEQTAPIGEATSDESGGFDIEVPSGDLKLIAEAGDVRGQTVLTGVVPGHEPADVIIRLAAGASLAGVVVDTAGAAASGAEVRLTVVGGDGPVGERTATSDGSGAFRFEHLAPGTATLEARGDGGVSPPLAVKLPDGSDRTGVRLVLAAAASIKGRVVDGKGTPVAGATVMATPAKSKIKPPRIVSGADGGFVLEGLAAGTKHVVQARQEGFANAFARNIVPPAEGVELVMQAAGGIRGVVKGAGGAPVSSFQVQVERFVEADGMVRPGRATARGSAKDGRFELDLVEPGQYDLVVTADGFAPFRPPRVAVPPEGWAEIEVELSAGARVTGRVLSEGLPVAGARIGVPAAYVGPAVFSDAQGRFTMVDVAPGKRSITASKAGLASASRELEVRAGQTSDVELTLAPGGAGKEVGVGIILSGSSQARPQVRGLKPRGAAARAGVRKRDIILSIDGVTTFDMPVDQAKQRLRGPPASTVRLEVEREGKMLRFDLQRAGD